jgi:acetyltransferase
MKSLELQLRDGTPVIARALSPDDRERLAEAYRRLSPDARYNRFWTRTGESVGDAMLTKVLTQDPERHISWAILDPSRDFPPIGGASWWRDATNPDEAEISAIVLDDDQNRGIGTLLLAIMWQTAKNAGIRSLVGYSLPENRQAANWMRDCGGVGTWDGYMLIFRWDLENPDMIPKTKRGADFRKWLKKLQPELAD